MAPTEIDWAAINAKLPIKRSPAEKEKRKKMFSDFDPNGNGILSLAEVDKSIRDVLNIDAIFDAKPAIMRAFQSAKTISDKKLTQKGQKKNIADDYISFSEFRMLLLGIRQYFEYYVAFSRVDTNDDNKITLSEFKQAGDMINKWVPDIADMEKTFNEIDSNDGGQVLFDEFCKWAIEKHLDLEDDVELEE